MKDLMRLFFDPPPIPPLEIPLVLKVAKVPIEKALELFYWRGCFDGFVFGVLLALLLLVPRRGK